MQSKYNYLYNNISILKQDKMSCKLYLLQTQVAFFNIDKSHPRKYDYGENFAFTCLQPEAL